MLTQINTSYNRIIVHIEISTTQEKEACWGTVELKPFGQGGGTMLLPGGYTSPERFVRTAFLKTHCKVPENRLEAIMTCFQILENVSIPKGIILTARDTYDYTKYIAFINTNTCQYYFKTYNNSQIATTGLRKSYINSKHPIFLGNLMRPVRFEKF